MKKILSILAGLTLIFSMTSCGGSSADLNNPESAAKHAISQAADSVPLADSPLFGQLPSIRIQENVALSNLKDLYSEAKKALESEVKDESSAQKAIEKIQSLKDNQKLAKEKIEEYYDGEWDKAAESLQGKEIPTEVDNANFTSAKVTINIDKSGRGGSCYWVALDAKLVPAKKDRWIEWRYLNAEGEEVAAGADTQKEVAEPGQEISIALGPNWVKMADVAKIYFYRN